MDTQERRASTNISLRISTELYERFKAAAESEHRSIAGEVRYLVEQRVEDHESKAAAA